jgi:hypothetical protein
MPGSRVAEFLVARDYDHFYQLAHCLSEYVLVRTIDFSTKAQVLKEIYKITPTKTFSNPDAVEIIENAIFHWNEFAPDAVEKVRRFFWPRLATEEGFHELNRQRWLPYDSQAWDDFFADFVLFMTPHLQTMTAFIQQLQTVETVSGVALKSDGTKSEWTVGKYIPEESYHQLKTLLSKAGLEAMLFATREHSEE